MKYDVRKSPIEGFGAFALQPIPKGESCGVAFTFPRSLLRIGKECVDNEIKRTMLGRYVNHDVYPNCTFQIVDRGEDIVLEYIASRFIAKGDELTLDYMAMPWEGVRNF